MANDDSDTQVKADALPINGVLVAYQMTLLQTLIWECLRFVLASHASGAVEGEFRLGIVAQVDPIAPTNTPPRPYLAVQTETTLSVLTLLSAHPVFEWRKLLGERWSIDAKALPKRVIVLNEEQSAAYVANILTILARSMAEAVRFETEAFGEAKEGTDGVEAICSAALFLIGVTMHSQRAAGARDVVWFEWSPSGALWVLCNFVEQNKSEILRIEYTAIKRSKIWSWVDGAIAWGLRGIQGETSQRLSMPELATDVSGLLSSIADTTAERILMRDPEFLKRVVQKLQYNRALS